MSLPTAIDRYQIRERIGQGGMGTLFLALDPAIDRLVALKVLRVDNPDVRERFEREARLAARLQHPNIVTIYDVGEHEGEPFIAMEYIPGDTLNDVIRRRVPLDLRRKVEMLIDVCAGLAYAHKHGIVHRDVKPANLIVSRDSQIVKILDFGIARAGESGLTQVGMVIGTPNYMSPEQVRGELVDHRSDIFAVGLVLYELLVYRRAFEADTQTAVLMKILNESPPTLLSLDPGLDPAVASIVERTLEKDPAKRPPDLGTLKAELTRLLYRLESTGPDDRTMIVPRPMPRTGGGAGASGRPPTGGPSSGPPSPAPPGAPAAPDVASLVRDARARIDAGALTEANTLLRRAAQLDPSSPEVASVREALERVLADREREQERSRRVASAVAHGHQALDAGSLDSAIRAVGEALGLAPSDPDALALRAEIQKRSPHGPDAPHAVAPPPPPLPPPLPAAIEPVAHTPRDGATAPERTTPRVPLAFLVAAALAALVFALAAIMIWRQVSARWSEPSTQSRSTAVPPARVEPSPAPAAEPPASAPSQPGPSQPGPSQPGATSPAPTPPPVDPSPATTPDPGALITARLAEAVRLFDERTTGPALDDLGELIDEAPERTDLRDTAERWARVLQLRAQQARARVPKPRRGTWPTPMRAANQLVRTGDLQLQNGEMLAAARSFEKGREAWERLANATGTSGSPREAPPDTRPESTPAPSTTSSRGEPSSAARSARAEPELAPSLPGREPTRPAEPLPDDEPVRAAINRTLAQFERAFESRSAESLRPIWPSLSSGTLQSYQSQFSRALFQQWTYTTRDIRVGPNGNRAVAQCTVTLSIQESGSRETRIETRTVRFDLERLGPLWVIAGVSGV